MNLIKSMFKKSKYLNYWLKVLILLGFTAVLIFLTLYFNQPPEPQKTDISSSEFSASRAMEHVKTIARKPHPTGSQENEKVREYLVKEMKKLGLETRVETYKGYLKTRYYKDDIELHNVIGVLKGTEEGKALMLSAHYDSVPTGPGANDNAAAVAALLEVGKIVKEEKPLKNDIWFVFTDGEEIGLLGAEVFWRNPEYLKKIGLVINFEARGSKGASVMYQTSDHNGMLIREFAKSAPNPLANSFMGDIYKILPNDTDLTVSLNAGVPGINFAYIDGQEVYHMPFDNAENVDQSSLQHHGDNALAMIQSFGNLELNSLRSPDHIYFNFFGRVIHYPESVVLPITIFLSIVLIFLFSVAIKKKFITFKGICLSFLTIGLTFMIATLISLALYKVIYILWANKMTLFNEVTYDSLLYKISFPFLTIIINAVIYSKLKLKINVLEMIMSGMLTFLILLHICTWFLPGASYLFSLPLFIYCIVIGLSIIGSNPAKYLNNPFIIMITTFLPIILFTTMFQLLFIGLPTLANISVIILFSILLALLDPINRLIIKRPRILVSFAMLVVILLLVTGWWKAENNHRPVYKNENSITVK